MAKDLDANKLVWDEGDFEEMNWHDCKVYAFGFKDESFEFVLDIDYIFKWIKPEGGKTHFKFWVAPATLVFENVWDLRIDLEGVIDIELQDLCRENPRPPKNAKYTRGSTEYDWSVMTNGGDIAFKSNGFKLYVRRAPIELDSQRMTIDERGGISFQTQISKQG